MTDHPIIFSAPMIAALLGGRKTQTRRLASSPLAKCLPGDRLWVRESFLHIDTTYTGKRKCWYMADGDGERPVLSSADPALNGKRVPWRPSIHMPRFASRLTLVVTEVRQQRLWDIDEDDAWAEGVIVPDFIADHPGLGEKFVMAYAYLWKTLHSPGSWDANPEVIALTFSVHRSNIDQMPASKGEAASGSALEYQPSPRLYPWCSSLSSPPGRRQQ